MKTFYTMLIMLAGIMGLRAQTEVIPANPPINNVTRAGVYQASSAADDSAFSKIEILPNLAVGRVTLVVNDANPNVVQQGECVIFNSGGRPVANAPFTTGTNQIYVTTFSAGLYYIRLVQNNGLVATKKFVVMR
ncbi:MAG TPA: T9SS type A sorting domain-containing protein [Chitinophagaceae bacterium]|nr:T9SS type A sorting domain-containing protein [Chitinophagaceae bacterium]